MRLFYLLAAVLLFISDASFAQNRIFDRPNLAGRSIFLDQGGGNTLIARERRFGWDSTQVHLFTANSDMEITHLGGFRLQATLTWLNHASRVDDGVILGGANLGFNTIPYVMRMDLQGNIQYGYFFPDLDDGQFQTIYTHVNGESLDLFTWSDNTRLSYYMINGTTDGSFPSAVQFHAPDEIEFRTNHFIPTGEPNDYISICQADTANSQSKFMIVMRVNTEGVVWSYIHDHATPLELEQENAFSPLKVSDGNYLFGASFQTGQGMHQRLVKIDGDGNVLWAKDYTMGEEIIFLGSFFELDDGGFIVRALTIESSLVMKIDANGEVLWSKEHIPEQTVGVPIGGFFKNDLGQMYTYNNLYIAELDDAVTLCDFVPHEGITASDATFDIVPVSHEITEVVPEVSELPYHLRSDEIAYSLACLSTDVESKTTESDLKIYPNPAQSELNFHLAAFTGIVELSIITMQGQVIERITYSASEERAALNVGHLASGVYMLDFRSDTKQERVRFVKQ